MAQNGWRRPGRFWMRDRWLRLTAGGFVLLLVAIACAPPTSPPPATSAPPAQPTPTQAAGLSVASAAQPGMPTAVPRSGSDKELILATTTSTQDSGLLDVLVPRFEQQTSYQVKTIAVGTGAALALGARGEADVMLVHAPAAEKNWMAQGNGTERLLVMHNDFIFVGPASDPARLKSAASAVDAMKKIADAEAAFVSRGDNSGTHQEEQSLWKQASIDPTGQPWYVQSGTGMGQTLVIADQKDAYTLSDRATWLAFKDRLKSTLLLDGDPDLFNVYHVMPVNPARFPNVKLNVAGGQAFADFLVAPETQSVIGEFGRDKYGQQLFIPDAGKRDEDVGG
jgi:tungstate transport system substrate-binding protein